LETVLEKNKEIMFIIKNRLGILEKKCYLFFNVNWEGYPGEIDLVVASDDKIECIVECKSRLFDIANGYL